MEAGMTIIQAQDMIIRLYARNLGILQEENAHLKELLAELERRLGLDSTTSSKPPSSEGLEKPKRKPISSRGKGKSKGGQKGHEGKTLTQIPTPDKIIVHKVEACCACGADLCEKPVHHTTNRQVFDVEIVRVVTEHQAEVKRCDCHAYTTASFPEDVKGPVQIGDTLRAISLYLSEQFIAKDRLSQVTEDLFGIPMSDTTILKYEAQLAENLQPFCEEASLYLKEKADVKGADESGIRVGGKTDWMHVLCDPFVTLLWHQVDRKCRLQNLKGTLVHDCYKSYLQLSVTHAFCNAHILRELKALSEYEQEPWSSEMAMLLRLMCHEKNDGRLAERKRSFYHEIYNKIVDRGFYYHSKLKPLKKPDRGRTKNRTGYNLLIRLRDFKEGILLFLKHDAVPFTNNQAEQDLRMVKVKQKVSGCFRTKQGVQNFAAIRSFILTVKKNGGNVFDAIKFALRNKVHLSQIFQPFIPTPLLALPPPS